MHSYLISLLYCHVECNITLCYLNFSSILAVYMYTTLAVLLFLQRVSIACYVERCVSYSKSVRPSVRPSVCLSVRLSVTRWHCVKTTQAIIMGSSLEDSPMTLVSSGLTSPQNAKGNMGSEGAK